MENKQHKLTKGDLAILATVTSLLAAFGAMKYHQMINDYGAHGPEQNIAIPAPEQHETGSGTPAVTFDEEPASQEANEPIFKALPMPPEYTAECVDVSGSVQIKGKNVLSVSVTLPKPGEYYVRYGNLPAVEVQALVPEKITYSMDSISDGVSMSSYKADLSRSKLSLANGLPVASEGTMAPYTGDELTYSGKAAGSVCAYTEQPAEPMEVLRILK